jgi:hypothetical protein
VWLLTYLLGKSSEQRLQRSQRMWGCQQQPCSKPATMFAVVSVLASRCVAARRVSGEAQRLHIVVAVHFAEFCIVHSAYWGAGTANSVAIFLVPCRTMHPCTAPYARLSICFEF